MKELRTNRVSDNIEVYGDHIENNIKMNKDFYDTIMNDVDTRKKVHF